MKFLIRICPYKIYILVSAKHSNSFHMTWSCHFWSVRQMKFNNITNSDVSLCTGNFGFLGKMRLNFARCFIFCTFSTSFSKVIILIIVSDSATKPDKGSSRSEPCFSVSNTLYSVSYYGIKFLFVLNSKITW